MASPWPTVPRSRTFMSLISHISPSQGSGNAKIHAVILLLKMLSIWWREICMWHLIRTQSTQHSERRIPRSLWECQGCGGDTSWGRWPSLLLVAILCWELSIHYKGRPYPETLWDPHALQRANFLPASMSVKYIVYFLFGELLFLFIMYFLINLNPVFLCIRDIILSYLMQIFSTAWLFSLACRRGDFALCGYSESLLTQTCHLSAFSI